MILYAGGTTALGDLLRAWARRVDAVVWDRQDHAWSLEDFLARL